MNITQLQLLLDQRVQAGYYGENPHIDKIIIKEIERFLVFFDKIDRQTQVNLKSLALAMPGRDYRRFLIRRSYDGGMETVDCLSLDFQFTYTLFWIIGTKLSVKVWFTDTPQFFVMSDIDEKARKVLWTLNLLALNE
jgi:hypothetical protein